MTPRLRLALRLPAVIFFLLTASYGLLSYVPFAYLQFLRHQLFAWLEFFVVFHHILYWAALLLGLLSISDDLKSRRRLPWFVAIAFSAYGLWLLFHPLLGSLTNDRRSLMAALGGLSFPVALAFVDHNSAGGPTRWEPASAAKARYDRFAFAGLYVWLTFALIALVRLHRAGGTTQLNGANQALASLWGLALHLSAATGLFLITAAIDRTARTERARHALLAGCMALGVWLVLTQIVFPAIAFHGFDAMAFAAAVGCSVAIVWSGFVVRYRNSPAPDQSHHASTAAQTTVLIVAALIAFATVEAIAHVDWYFLLQRLVALGVWTTAIVCTREATASRFGRRALAASMTASVLAITATHAMVSSAASRLALATDQYSSYDPSVMLLDGALTPASSELADLTRYLVANSNVTDATPAPIDFATSWNGSARRRPNIFLFVIDSLRRDYLSPYNGTVRFTPSIDAFARESIAFTRAYTRYGGTGLSEPAIWAGAMLPHKEYATPFAPMNALEKLLVAEKYHRLISVDSILRQLLTPSPDIHELDAGIQNRRYELCRTLQEVRRLLPEVTRDGRPAFVFTQSQDVHLANVAVDREGTPADAYPGFYAPYARRLERLDACFGAFITYLKDIGQYDNSVVILTSDHGDSLGDEGRWGHAYTVFPEVIRVPLIVRAPETGDGTVDADALAFTTDITPTLYKILGYRPMRENGMFGMAIIGADRTAIQKRRTLPYLVASSYGPVYGLLTSNGDDLYIIDAINTVERRYDLRRGFNGEPTAITQTARAGAAPVIRRQVGEIAGYYATEAASVR